MYIIPIDNPGFHLLNISGLEDFFPRSKLQGFLHFFQNRFFFFSLSLIIPAVPSSSMPCCLTQERDIRSAKWKSAWCLVLWGLMSPPAVTHHGPPPGQTFSTSASGCSLACPDVCQCKVMKLPTSLSWRLCHWELGHLLYKCHRWHRRHHVPHCLLWGLRSRQRKLCTFNSHLQLLFIKTATCHRCPFCLCSHVSVHVSHNKAYAGLHKLKGSW